LPWLQRAGFDAVEGVEPSGTAVQGADLQVQAMIRGGPFDAANHQAGQFGFVCCFYTLEHAVHPRNVVAGMATLLKPGGRAAIVVHDYAACINGLLGHRSPSVDIEYLQLFSRASLKAWCKRVAVRPLVMTSISNRYPLRYWLRLSPLPSAVR